MGEGWGGKEMRPLIKHPALMPVLASCLLKKKEQSRQNVELNCILVGYNISGTVEKAPITYACDFYGSYCKIM